MIRKLIRLGFIGKAVRPYVIYVLSDSFGDLFMKVEVLPEETWLEFYIDAKHIVHYQHLSIAMRPGANPDGRYFQTFRYFFCEVSRYLLQHDCKTPGFFQQFGICP